MLLNRCVYGKKEGSRASYSAILLTSLSRENWSLTVITLQFWISQLCFLSMENALKWFLSSCSNSPTPLYLSLFSFLSTIHPSSYFHLLIYFPLSSPLFISLLPSFSLFLPSFCILSTFLSCHGRRLVMAVNNTGKVLVFIKLKYPIVITYNMLLISEEWGILGIMLYGSSFVMSSHSSVYVIMIKSVQWFRWWNSSI